MAPQYDAAKGDLSSMSADDQARAFYVQTAPARFGD